MKMFGANPSSRWRFSEARPSDHHCVGRARISGRRSAPSSGRLVQLMRKWDDMAILMAMFIHDMAIFICSRIK